MSIHLRRLQVALTAALACLAGTATAQVPGTPVLQNAFGNPGLAFAANYGGGTEQSFFGAASAWGLRGGRFTLSGSAGAQRANDATRGAYGARAAATVWTTSGGSLGVGAFAGIGGAPRTRSGNTVTNPAVGVLPAGLTVAYQRPLGRTRGVSLYVSPFYRWTRLDSAAVTSSGAVRVSAGLDFAFSPSIGATIGGEFGQSGSDAGRNHSSIGAAISFVPGRR